MDYPATTAHAHPHDHSHYYVPHGTRWPIFGSIGLFTLMTGAALWLNDFERRAVARARRLRASWSSCCSRWFGNVIGESEGGLYNKQVDSSFRWGMSWFIFSEVMFFAVFFGTLFYARAARRAVARGRRRRLLHEPAAVARLREHVAVGRVRHGPARRARWAPGASRRSTPRCCSRAASRSRSRTTCCGRPARRADRSGSRRRSCSASCSCAYRRASTSTPTRSSASGSTPASTARRSSC